MWHNTESDPEAPWRTAGSSAGAPTRPLEPMPSSGPTPAARRRNNLIALVILALGVLLLFGRHMPWHAGPRHGPGPLIPHMEPMFWWPMINVVPGMILLMIASVFLFFAFWRRIYPLIIPGCILAGLSAGVTLVNPTGGVSVLWGLAFGFLAIYLVGKALWRIDQLWPLIPGAILFGIGASVALTQLPALFTASMLWLPLLLIGAGLYLGWMRRP